MNTSELTQKWETLRKEQPKLRIKNAADILGVSEVELLATKIGTTVTRLKASKIKEILSEIESLGKVMALTRNNECVHERKGVYINAQMNSPHVGLFVGEDIDLRMFFAHWNKVFTITEENTRGTSRSIQFFGKDGLAIHKIFLVKQSNLEAFDSLINKYKDTDQTLGEQTQIVSRDIDELLDDEIDTQGFHKSWKELKDTHHFFMMLKKYKVSRTQALRLAPSNYYAKEISKDKIVTMLETVAKKQTPIMVFVANRGNIQIHTGNIKKTLWYEDWFNIMDPDFNLHLDMTKIAKTWIVRKPTEDGIVTAIEVFNEMGEQIVQFFGKRKPGIPELKEWQDIIENLEK